MELRGSGDQLGAVLCVPRCFLNRDKHMTVAEPHPAPDQNLIQSH